ncbi:MAG: hypothetical protein KDA33_09385, partial [Phycisphaerales bacterium]|nr:hypothetical protein [Phycisphaerales bacterium]
VVQRNHDRAQHLVREKQVPIMVSLHNISHYHRLIRRIRAAIASGTMAALKAEMESRETAGPDRPQEEV